MFSLVALLALARFFRERALRSLLGQQVFDVTVNSIRVMMVAKGDLTPQALVGRVGRAEVCRTASLILKRLTLLNRCVRCLALPLDFLQGARRQRLRSTARPPAARPADPVLWRGLCFPSGARLPRPRFASHAGPATH